MDEALEVLREYLPLPAVTGRVCPHPCEAECARREVDEAVNLSALERYVADRFLTEKARPAHQMYAARVAVVGSGPAGVSCAYFLAPETLAKGREALQATEDGVCDVAMINLAFVAKQWSLNSVVTLGSLVIPNDRGTELWDRLLERFPEMAAEMGTVKVLGKSVATTTSLHVKDKEVRVPADLEGLKIAALGDSALRAGRGRHQCERLVGGLGHGREEGPYRRLHGARVRGHRPGAAADFRLSS